MTGPLFEPEPPRHGPIATVAPVAPIDKTYPYAVPDALVDRLRSGARVLVRLGRRTRSEPGFCVALSEGAWDTSLRPLDDVIDAQPLLSPRLLELGRWIARYYGCPLGHTLQAMVPGGVRRHAGSRAVRYAILAPGAGPVVEPAGAKRGAALAALRAGGGRMRVAELARAAGCGPEVIRALARSGALAIERVEEFAPPALPAAEPVEPDYALNDDQSMAVERMTAAVRGGAFGVQLLFGVTGSGKTECYVRTIRAAHALGRQAILLVPEIALTTQTVTRLAHRFARVAVLHSGLTDAQRARLWTAAAAGQIDLVIGTRSAVFAPLPRLGLIVCDEEHEPGYKNFAAPRFHTRDVAIKRAQLESARVVLGSATPSLETWLNVQRQGHFELLRLPRRVRGLALPRVALVDMRDEHHQRRGVHMLSRAMEERLAEVLTRGEQAVLLLNRRGHSSFLFCAACRTPVVCPNCTVHMVFHASAGVALCHYCHERMVVPTRCAMAGCGGTLNRFGMGTQRVEAELAGLFPAARIGRLDSDAMKHPRDYVRVLEAFEARRLDVLVGTQMVAKGLDFPFVSFVGVVSADTALALPDFRSTERTFQLVLQVAGRSGRGDVGGDVIVQSFATDLSAIRRAVAGDYEGFAAEELATRRSARLPPFARLVRIVLADARLSRLRSAADGLAKTLAEVLAKYNLPARVFPPHPSPIVRLKNRYRFDLLLRFDTATAMLRGLDVLRAGGHFRTGVNAMIVDVDPVSMQ